MADALGGQAFPNGLALIYVGQVPIPGPEPDDFASLTKPLVLEGLVAKVPRQTKYVHVAVVAMDLSFGDPAERKVPSKVGRVGFEVITRDDSNDRLALGEYKFDFKALLQDGAEHNPTGKWSGHFWLEIMCFGDIPR